MTQRHSNRALDSIVGSWTVMMTVVDDDGATTRADGLRADKTWFGDGRYVLEHIEGDFQSERHKKLTLLGYNATRDRFEYVTADNHDGVVLFYTTLPTAAGRGREIELFTDYAMPQGETDRAIFITIRTTLSVESPDRHVLRNAYRYAGGIEKPFLEYIYTRKQEPA